MGNSIQSYLDDVVACRAQLTIEIEAEDGSAAGEMRPLTMEHIAQPEILQMLTDWRNLNMARFLTQFNATPERTKDWLTNVVFKAPGQMLFLIYEAGRLVGHLGFKGLSAQECVLDNAIKGEQTIDPKLFVHAHRALAKWLFREAKTIRLHGLVLTDNISAIMMNRQIGWAGWIKCPLLKEKNNGEITWRLGEENQSSPDGKYCFKIVLHNDL
jgi:hypothetical protein